jgi:hypothetical protein
MMTPLVMYFARSVAKCFSIGSDSRSMSPSSTSSVTGPLSSSTGATSRRERA